MVGGHRRRAHAQMHRAGVAGVRVCHQLHRVAQLPRIPEVGEVDVADANTVDGLRLHVHTKGKPRHDHQLVRRVPAVEVGARIRLGVAALRRVCQRSAQGDPVTSHVREDDVGGSVDDRVDARDAICAEASAKQSDHGQAGADRGLEPESRAVLFRQSRELRALVCNEQLVRRHHRLPRGERVLDERRGRLATADDLDDDADVRVVDHGGRVGDERHVLEVHRARTLGVAHCDTS